MKLVKFIFWLKSLVLCLHAKEMFRMHGNWEKFLWRGEHNFYNKSDEVNE